MKRSELKRTKPLERKTALGVAPLARSRLHAGQRPSVKPATRRPKDTGPSKAVVIAVLARDAYCCVRCGGALWGVRGRDYSIQHRRARGAGGSRREDTNHPQNLLSTCGSATSGCHGLMERLRNEARAMGWAIRQSDDPLQVPVQHWQYGLIFLGADGSWSSRPPTTAEEATR